MCVCVVIVLLHSPSTLTLPCAALAKREIEKLVPWLLESDTDPLVSVERSRNGNGVKTVRNFSEISHHVCSTRGATDLTVVDHDVAPKLDEAQSQLCRQMHVAS